MDNTNESAEMALEIWWDASQGNELYIKDIFVQTDNIKYHPKDGNPWPA